MVVPDILQSVVAVCLAQAVHTETWKYLWDNTSASFCAFYVYFRGNFLSVLLVMGIEKGVIYRQCFYCAKVFVRYSFQASTLYIVLGMFSVSTLQRWQKLQILILFSTSYIYIYTVTVKKRLACLHFLLFFFFFCEVLFFSTFKE